MSRRYRPSWVLALMLIVAGCSGPREGAESVAPLRIAAASDLRRALPALLAIYADRDGPVAPPSFGASADLTGQIRSGAPFDVFLSADLTLPKELEGEGLIAGGSIVPYARGSLVMLVHPDVAAAVESLADLAKPEVRKIAIANPGVAPYGQAARAALEKAGLWESLQAKIVPAGSVSQAFLHVEDGNADAGLVSRSLVADAKSKVVEVDPALYPPRIQGLGILARSKQKERAQRFVEFLLGEEGRHVLAENGLAPPRS